MQLTPSVVTTLASPLTLLYHINRGREVHERGLWNLCIVMLEESGLSLPTPLPWRSSLVLQSLEAEFIGEEIQQNQIKVS